MFSIMSISMVNEEQGQGQRDGHGDGDSDGAFVVDPDDNVEVDVDEGNVNGGNDADDDDDESQISMIDDDELIARLSEEESDSESDDSDDESDDDSMDDGDLHYCTYKGSRTKILQELITPLERRLVWHNIMTKKSELFQILREKIDRIISVPTTTCTRIPTSATTTTTTALSCCTSTAGNKDDDNNKCNDGGIVYIDDSIVLDYLSKIYRVLKMSLFHHSNNEVRINVLRDTFEQVATSIRLFPYVLKETYRGLLPIAWQFGNCVKTTPYILLFAQLGVEYTPQLFTEEQRGGLLMTNYNVIKGACCNERYYKPTDVEYQQKVDTKRLDVLISLREHNLMLKGDIEKYSLLETVINEKIFATQRFNYLIEWDPSLLSKPVLRFDDFSSNNTTSVILPLHLASMKLSTSLAQSSNTALVTSIDMFRTIFELGYKYYPKEMGFLFYTSGHKSAVELRIVITTTTPFRLVCERFTSTKVIEIIDDIIVQYRNRQTQSAATATTDNDMVDDTMTTNMATTYTLSHYQFIHAIMNDNVHMEGVNKLIRNDPSIVQQLLLVREPSKQRQPFKKQSLLALSQSKQPPSSSSLVSLQSQSSASSSSLLSLSSNNNNNQVEEKVVTTGTRVCVCRYDGNNNDANDNNDTTTTQHHIQHHHYCEHHNSKRRRVQVQQME